ncbi:hypothetical protein EC973_005693 [Apophysomyces ossiformis]|uniref:Arrestin C-terminal-like domain-containing protein n=1 Tax=Apophysomyces ossiformis TaxID=679940 RepID=A0A8H7ESQ5_9FUNG|nr:hypothetical protein EC973_005693 [Apophysomyces ossiformis]
MVHSPAIIAHPMQFVHGCEFKINLETEHIILHGSVDESAGVILRGSVSLDCHETTKVRSVTLRFFAKAKVGWTEGSGSHQHHYKEERTILQHEWHFMPPTRKAYQLAEGQYKWDFELPLPGDLPESVDHPLGQVYYRLKAVAERPTFSMNYSDKRTVRVSRMMLPSSLDLTQTVMISNVWTDKLSYDISVPSKVFNLGSIIPVTYTLIPIAPDLRVRAVACSLKEYTTLSAEEHSKTESRVIKFAREDQFTASNGPWSKTELIHVPEAEARQILTDSMCDLIKVKHKIKFTVSLVNADGHISELRAAIPVIIAAVSPEEDVNALPAYEDAWKSLPYDPSMVSALIAAGGLPPSVALAIPNEAASRARTAVAEEAEEYDDTPSPWQGVDLSRVPSYTTAIRSGRLYSFSGSLPAYDSVAVPGNTSTS